MILRGYYFQFILLLVYLHYKSLKNDAFLQVGRSAHFTRSKAAPDHHIIGQRGQKGQCFRRKVPIRVFILPLNNSNHRT